MTAGDYDGRTPLMLAASNGHIDCLKYILVQANKHLKPKAMKKFVLAEDAFGGTALIDAIREKHETCIKELEKNQWNEDIDNQISFAGSTENSPRIGSRMPSTKSLFAPDQVGKDELVKKMVDDHKR